jgi:hypothetical protein
MNEFLKQAWYIANISKGTINDNGQTLASLVDNKTRLQALALFNDCHKSIMT